MFYWGKVIGACFGYLLAGPIGALLGIIVGSIFDKGLDQSFRDPLGLNKRTQETQALFFKITFQLMGHIAKADGRVSEQEIQSASIIMRQMRLNEAQRRQAIEYFNQGKAAQFDSSAALNELINGCHQQRMLLRMFVEIQFQAASAEGQISPKKFTILQAICQRLGFEPMFNQYRYRQQHYQHQGQQQYSNGPSPQTQLANAYNTLEIKESASPGEIKKTYRKLMSQHHPDKLIAKGLPETMIKMATDKTQQIQKAYELIKSARGF